MKVLNVSNHVLSDVQIEDLRKNWEVTEVIELPSDLKNLWSNLTPENYKEVSDKIIDIAVKEDHPFLHIAGFPPAVNYIAQNYELSIYAFSERSSKDIPQEDGTVRKVSIFNHKGFYRY